ncbi:MAG: NAD(P)H-hydrate epimerase [Planctomycetota bacterium]
MPVRDPLRPRTRSEMRELDRRASVDYGIPSLLLMENAGRAAAEAARRMLGAQREGTGVIVFCGKGNNGGDGFCVARHLHNMGFEVRCYFAGALRELKRGTDAEINMDICRRMRIPVLQHAIPEDRDEMARTVAWARLLIDGLLGTGLSGEVRPPYSTLISFLNVRSAPILALDIPSGLDADTGEILGKCVRATRTVTFGAPKVGFKRGQGPHVTGEVEVCDISIPRELLEA